METVVTNFDLLWQYLPREAEEKHRKALFKR